MGILQDKVAVITGAAQGIGWAVAEKYAAEGARVVIADINLEKAREKAGLIDGYACEADITKADQIQNVIDTVKTTFGKIDILVNNAGIQPKSESFWEISEESWDKVMNLDLKSVFLFSKSIVPVFMDQKCGCIVNTSSVSGLYLWNKSVHYITAKAAIIDLTRAMAYELADYQIRVNAVAPGHVDTELNAASLSEDGGRKNRENQIPLGKIAKPAELAGAFAFLASDAAAAITGMTMYVDGGLTQLK